MAEETNIHSKQNVIRPKGQTTCIHHNREPLRLHCETCDVLVCVLCVTSVHKNHQFVSFNNVIPDRKQEIRTFIDRTEKTDIDQNNRELDSCHKTRQKNGEYFNNLDDKLVMQEKKLITIIRDLIGEIRSLHQKVRDENARNINRYTKQLEDRGRALRQILEEGQEVLQTGSEIQVFDAHDEIKILHSTIPFKPKMGTADFTPNTNPQHYLEQALGQASVIRSPTTRQETSANPQRYLEQALGQASVTRSPSTRQETSANPQSSLEQALGQASVTRSPSTRQETSANPQHYLEQALGQASVTRSPSTLQETSANPQSYHGYLEQALGQASVTRSPTTRQETSGTNKGRMSDCNPQYKLVDEARIMQEFKSPYGIRAICATSDGAWTCDYSSTVTHFNKEGEVLQKIKYKVWISDVSVSPITNNVWTCSSQNYSIMECKPKWKPVVTFKTDVQPQSLCCALDGCLLVGMCNKLTKFDTKGKVLLTTTSSQSGRPLVCTPHRITECSVTHNIAVADRDWSSDGGEDKPRVIIINSDFQELFQYTGIVPSSQQRITKRVSEPFNPWDVRYDTVGNIVIPDRDNGCLHLLSGRGEYMRLLHTDSGWVRCIGIDKANVLWVVFGDNTVKPLQYGVVGGST